jgi:hypothetical protein
MIHSIPSLPAVTRSPGRYELRHARSGRLESVHAHFESARREADALGKEFGETFAIVDLALPRTLFDGTIDTRIVWRSGEVTPLAIGWIRRWCTYSWGAS